MLNESIKEQLEGTIKACKEQVLPEYKKLEKVLFGLQRHLRHFGQDPDQICKLAIIEATSSRHWIEEIIKNLEEYLNQDKEDK